MDMQALKKVDVEYKTKIYELHDLKVECSDDIEW